MGNPLLSTEQFAHYDQIKAEHFVPGMEEIIKIAKQGIKELISLECERTFDNTIIPAMEIDEKISKVMLPMIQLSN